MITTVTPFWNRPDMLRGWVRALRGASFPGVRHIIYFVGEGVPDWWKSEIGFLPITAVVCDEAPCLSIGHYHNLGIQAAQSEWVMKMDVDTIPHTRFFSELIGVLKDAKEREWFNVGMVLVHQFATNSLLCDDKLPLTEDLYRYVMAFLKVGPPVATNFVCRRNDYLLLGGCDERFRGWGWEDYQQIYMLERYQLGKDPLPGPVYDRNVTVRCRDEISRSKARELFVKNKWLCLIHRFHEKSIDPAYRCPENSTANRRLLLDYITKAKKNETPNI